MCCCLICVAHSSVVTLSQVLHQLAPRRYGRQTAERLLNVAKGSISSAAALSARSTALRLLCDQLEQTLANVKQLQQEIKA